ncbi:ribonuclease E/G [Peptostreptococcus faecalis]|uniref:ribonuclease E/G n=1 Tax=Peptostreptococcus faecalis TaxID=2045015 RepID=UPI000C7B8B74|nr:ribonuclease E/G [Peptostreptococcus faecalis]
MKEFIIESFVNSNKLAVVENGEIQKLIIEENENYVRVKNIYSGVIKKIIKGMKSCFVDIGQKDPGYLKMDDEFDYVEGEKILVQVIKEEKDEKRVKLTTEISLSGPYIVFIPTNNKITFSNKIKDKNERKRLKEIVSNIDSANCGYILRTESVGKTNEEISRDIYNLKLKYNNILKKYKSSSKPILISEPESEIEKFIRDNFDDSVEKIIYSDGKFDRILRDTAISINREYLYKLKRESEVDIFEAYGVNNKLKKYLSKRVWFGDGANIVIEKTEAMTVIDVNSGRYIGHSNYENTVLKVNIAAAKEIAKQIIIRDLTGMILIDFIDMSSKEDKYLLLNTLNENLSCDSRYSKVHGFTRLGIVEITRRRSGKSIEEYYNKNIYQSQDTINSIVDKIEKNALLAKSNSLYEKIIVSIDEKIYEDLLKIKNEVIVNISEKYGIDIELKMNIKENDIKFEYIKKSVY